MPVGWSGIRNGKSNSRRFATRRRDIGGAGSATLNDTPKHLCIELFLNSVARGTLQNEAGQIPEGNGRQQGSSSQVSPRIGFQRRRQEIGRSPWESNDAAEPQPEHYPGQLFSPKDASHPARLTAVRAVLRNNRHRTSAKCNIRCCLLLV